MANVLNRTTREYLRSVHDPDYPVQDWIHNPDLSAVVGYPSKYWVITGDAVSLMTQSERDAVDAAELIARRDEEAAQLDNLEGIIRALFQVMVEEFNRHADKENEILVAGRTATSLADFKSKMTSIQDYPQRTLEQLRTAIRNKLGS